MKFEFFFDCSSPWTYLAFTNIQPIAARHGVDITWRPLLVGGIFNTVNDSVYSARQNPVPAKAAYQGKDLADWADAAGINIGSPPVFPVNSVKAMRGAFLALEMGVLVPYASAVFRTYWSDLQDISQDDVLTQVIAGVGIEERVFFDYIRSAPAKAALRDNTDEAIKRGAFGSPTMFVNDTDMYFGNDRLPLVERAFLRD